jgi:hypothetical protein
MDKKHEDAGGVAQIDKTSVFQEGRKPLVHLNKWWGICWHDGKLTALSTRVQSEPYITTEMQSGMSPGRMEAAGMS